MFSAVSFFSITFRLRVPERQPVPFASTPMTTVFKLTTEVFPIGHYRRPASTVTVVLDIGPNGYLFRYTQVVGGLRVVTIIS